MDNDCERGRLQEDGMQLQGQCCLFLLCSFKTCDWLKMGSNWGWGGQTELYMLKPADSPLLTQTLIMFLHCPCC